MKILTFLLLAIFTAIYCEAQISLTSTAGTLLSANYPQLNLAFNKINDGTHQGVITLQITANTTETTSAVLNASGSGSASYSAVNIYPTVTGITIAGNIASPLIDLNGADNVTIDGRVNATGNTNDLTITNTSTTANSTIRFIEDATSNTIKYSTIKGSTGIAAGGIIFFSTTTQTSGNDGNTLDHNNVTSASSSRPRNAIYSSGTALKENSGNIISNSNIYDVLNKTLTSGCITLYDHTTAWTISGNSFYETTDFIPSDLDAAYVIIKITYLTYKGSDYMISGNFFGGNAANCGGGAWTKTNAKNNSFSAINLSVANSPVSNIQNNTIQNFNWSNSGAASWTAIQVNEGSVNIGTQSGNVIGSNTGTGSISITGGATGTNVFGITTAGNGTIVCNNNTIGSITAGNSNGANATNVYGINKTSSGTCTFNNNTIGSQSQGNSIQSTSNSTDNPQSVIGISNTSGAAPTLTLNANTIANLTNETTNANIATAGRVNGIISTIGVGNITNNAIHDLAIANSNNASDQNASVGGIVLTASNALQTVSGNTGYNLYNTNSSFSGSVTGVYFGATGTSPINHQVSGNFIHGLSVNTSAISASVYGIKINSGNSTYSNNIITLGDNTSTNLYGIYESGASLHNNSLYFNTINIGGAPTTGSNNSYALYSAASTNVRNFRNNLLVNTRSNNGATGAHFATYLNYTTNTNLTSNYNDYYATGTGGVLGYHTDSPYNASNDITTLAAWKTATGQDAGSVSSDPGFNHAGGAAPADYTTTAALNGVSGTGITTDYAGLTRIATPKMGAYENYCVWQGDISTDFATPGNWLGDDVPGTTDNILIPNVTNNPVVNEAPASPAEGNSLIIEAGAVLTVAAGKALTVNATLINNAGNAGLVIQSTAAGTGSLIATNSVSATVQRFISNDRKWHFLSSPVTSQPIWPEFAPTPAGTTTLTFGASPWYWDFYYWNPNALTASDLYWVNLRQTTGDYNSWPVDESGSSAGFGTAIPSFTVGRGYLVNYFTNWNTATGSPETHLFTGSLNSGSIGRAVVNGSNPYNLIGNPYTSAIDWNSANWTRSVLQTSGSGYDYWIYNNSSNNYGVCNSADETGTNGTTRYIAPMQGFFVQANTSGTVTMNGVQVHAAQTWLKESTAVENILRFKLTTSANSFSDEMILAVSPDYENGGSPKFWSMENDAPELYAIKDATNYSIRRLTGVDESTVVVLGIKAGITANYTFYATGADQFSLADHLILEDLKTGTIQDLKMNPLYSFAASPSDDPIRFHLRFGSPFDIDNPEIQPGFSVFSTGKAVVINNISGTHSDGTVYICNVLGQKITEQKLQFPETRINLNVSAGWYLVTWVTRNQTYSKKVYLN